MSKYPCFVGHLAAIEGADFAAPARISRPIDGCHRTCRVFVSGAVQDMQKGRKFLITYLVLPIMVVLLAGCGSGDKSIDDGPDYSGSGLQVQVTPRIQNGVIDNILTLAWTELFGIDFYRLWVDPDGRSGFEQIVDADGNGDIFFDEEIPDPDELPICYYVPEGEPDEPGVDCLFLPPNCADVPDEEPHVPYVDCQPVLVLYGYEQIALHLFKWPDALFMLEACRGDPAQEADVECYIVGNQSVKNLSASAVDAFTAPAPNQNRATFGISVAASEDGLLMAVGGNTTSVFECEEVTYTHILETNEEETEYLPCQVYRALPYCPYVPEGEPDEPGVDCLDLPPFCVDTPDGDSSDPDSDNYCLPILPYCVDRDDPEPGENCVDEVPFCLDRFAPIPDGPEANCRVADYCVEDDDPESVPGETCVDRLPDCDDRPEGVPGETCAVNIDCEALAEDEETPLQCIVYQTIPNAGAVYLYGRDSEIEPWELDQFLKAPTVEANDNFGWAVAMSDDGATIAISALGEDGDTSGDPENNDVASAGAAYIYTRDADEWVFTDYLKADNAEAEDLFGWALDISGDGSIIAVSAAREANDLLADVNDELLCEGAVYVYVLDGLDQWSQQAYLKAANPQQNDVFGASLSLDYTGSLLAVGAIQDPDDNFLDEQTEFDDSVLLRGCDPEANPEVNPGFVGLYERTDSSWSAPTELRASNADNSDRFGNSVSLNSGSGTTENAATRLAVGAPREDGPSTGLNGSEGNDSAAQSSGAVYLFDKAISGEWLQSQYLKASNTGLTDVFGTAVALSRSGTTLAVGAEGEAGPLPGVNRAEGFDNAPGTGAIYIYKEDTETFLWSQVAYVKPPGVIPGGMGFGWDLELANDGDMLAGSAPAFRALGGIPGSVFVY